MPDEFRQIVFVMLDQHAQPFGILQIDREVVFNIHGKWIFSFSTPGPVAVAWEVGIAEKISHHVTKRFSQFCIMTEFEAVGIS